MTERAYTVAEIDDLRCATETRLMFGTTFVDWENNPHGRAAVLPASGKLEDRVRTYMLAGITAQQMRVEDKAAHEKYQTDKAAYLALLATKKETT